MINWVASITSHRELHLAHMNQGAGRARVVRLRLNTGLAGFIDIKEVGIRLKWTMKYYISLSLSFFGSESYEPGLLRPLFYQIMIVSGLARQLDCRSRNISN